MKKTLMGGLLVAGALALSGCNQAHTNTLALGGLGGIAGALGGSHIGGGKGRLIATGAGGLLGTVLGAFVGNKFDSINSNQAAISALAIQQQKQQNQQRSQYGSTHTTNVYQQGLGYSQYGSTGMYCTIRNNYVSCSSR